MGQAMTITSTTVDGAVAAFHTDRGITGQDGVSFDSAESAATDDGFAAGLATRLFDGDPAIDHVFIASNQVVVRRPDGWDAARLEAAGDIVARFFVFYSEA